MNTILLEVHISDTRVRLSVTVDESVTFALLTPAEARRLGGILLEAAADVVKAGAN